jgi:hypothetical protein
LLREPPRLLELLLELFLLRPLELDPPRELLLALLPDLRPLADFDPPLFPLFLVAMS